MELAPLIKSGRFAQDTIPNIYNLIMVLSQVPENYDERNPIFDDMGRRLLTQPFGRKAQAGPVGVPCIAILRE